MRWAFYIAARIVSARRDILPVLRAILAFVAIVTALAIAISVAVALTGGPRGPLGALGFVTMLLPAAAAYAVGAATNQAPRIDWSRAPAPYVLVALLLIPGVMHAAMLPAMQKAAGRLPWSDHPAWPAIVVNAIVGLFVVSLLALFEEIGWRGWLLPRLLDRCSAATAIFLSSIAWAAWHVPFVLSGILVADGVSTGQELVIVPLGIAGAGLVLGWLWVRTRSIWIVTLAHGAMNHWGQFAFKYMEAGPTVDLAPVLLAGSLAVVAVGTVLVIGLRRRPERVAACGVLTIALCQSTAPPQPGEPLKTYRVSTSATWAQPVISGNGIFVKDASSVALWTVR